MDPNLAENPRQHAIMGWWTTQIEGRKMHLWETLGDFLDITTPILQQIPPHMTVPYMVDLQILYLISLLTPEWQDVGNDLRILGPYDDFVTFITHLCEIEPYLNPISKAANRSCEEELEERDLTSRIRNRGRATLF